MPSPSQSATNSLSTFLTPDAKALELEGGDQNTFSNGFAPLGFDTVNFFASAKDVKAVVQDCAKVTKPASFTIPEGRSIEKIDLPTGVEIKSETGVVYKTFVTAKDNKAYLIPVSTNTRDAINSWIQKNLDAMDITVSRLSSLPALNLRSSHSPMTRRDPKLHPLGQDIFSFLDQMARDTGCKIETAKVRNDFVVNYFSQRGKKAFEGDKLKCALFTNPDNSVETLHIDLAKKEDRFNFTLTIFVCNEAFSKLDRKRMLFPKATFSLARKYDATFIDIDYQKPIMALFPSYTLHGIEEWSLKRYHRAAKKIQTAYRFFAKQPGHGKDQKAVSSSQVSKEVDELMTAFMQTANDSQELDRRITELAKKITQNAKNKLVDKSTANFTNNAMSVWEQQTKVKLIAECIAWFKPGRATDIKPKLYLIDRLDIEKQSLLKQLEIHSFPYRISIVWRGSASKAGLNCEQLADVIGKYVLSLKSTEPEVFAVDNIDEECVPVRFTA